MAVDPHGVEGDGLGVLPQEVPLALESLFERLNRIHSPAQVAAIHRSMILPKRTGYFVNPFLPGGRALPGEPIPGMERCGAVPAADREALLADAAVTDGALYPINPSSVLAARALGARPGEEVLDLAAAPGGKTLILAAAMGNSGRIAAVEAVKGRFHRMRANLERLGVTNVQLYLADGRSIGRKVPERFDRVLLDAPCSSEARIRLDEPSSYAHWKPRKIRETARKQRGLIRSAFAALKPGGEMLYCTCAFAPEENELVVAYLLGAEPAAVLLTLDVPGHPGLTCWEGRELDPRLERTRRILPDDLFDGFFIARIGKA